jgi:uncharacterized protein
MATFRYNVSSVPAQYIVKDVVRSTNKDPQAKGAVWLDLEPKDMVKHGFTGDIVVTKDRAAVISSVMNILQTNQGELVHLPEFGCDLNRFVFEPITGENTVLIESTIRDAIREWEPRVISVNVSAVADKEENRYLVSLSFDVIGVGNIILPTFAINRVL